MSIKLLKRLSCGIISGVCCCLFCLLLATAANADVCFLPTGQCEAASANLSTGCSGFNLTGAKDETGWNCTQCGEKWKCEKKSCKDDYKTDVRCSGTETKVCDETRKAGDESCCKCEDSVTKCQHEGYVYKTTNTNENCTGKCPYNASYFESCECNAKYDKSSNTNACYTYNTCELGDLAGTKKYEQASDVHKCKAYIDNAEYVTDNSEQVKSGDYDCTLVCTETCDNSNRKYYQCSPKGKCKEAEGKYATKELCEASLQHASVFDIFKKYIPNFNYTPNFNLISTSYAAVTDPELSEEACAHCRYASNYQSCMDACNPQTKVDGPLCPIDQDRKCVSCVNNCTRGAAYTSYPCCANVNRGCIGMMMNVDQDCVKCLKDNPTWRADGCEDYPCCLEEVETLLCRINLEKNCAKCDGECDRGSYSCCLDEPQITDCQIDVDRECAKCDGVCTNKIDCCDDVENSPCELKDGCWVAKVQSGCHYNTVAQCKAAGYTYTAAERWEIEESANPGTTGECEPCDCGGTEMNKCTLYTDCAGYEYKQSQVSNGALKTFPERYEECVQTVTLDTYYKCAHGYSWSYAGSGQYQCVANTVTCTIDPDDPDVFDPGYWQLDNISCDNGTTIATPGNVTLRYSSDSGCHTTVDVTVGKGSTMSGALLSTASGSCSGIGCTISHGGNSWCSQVKNTCSIFGSEFSKDSTGYYVTENGQKIYWKIGGSENYTGDCSAGGGCESQYKSQCDSWGGTLKSSTTSVTEDVCHAVYGECDNEYWYCLKPGCSDDDSKVTVYYDAPTNCNYSFNFTNKSTNAVTQVGAATQTIVPGTYTVRPSTMGVQSFTIKMGRGGTPICYNTSGTDYTFSIGNEYWIVPNCSSTCSGSSGTGSGGNSGGSSTTSCSGARPIKYTNIPMTSTSTTCIDVCCGPNADVPSSYSYLGDCNGVGSTYTCPPTTSSILCYRDVQGILHETDGVETGSGITRHCVPGWIQVPHYTRCFGSYLVGCTGG